MLKNFKSLFPLLTLVFILMLTFTSKLLAETEFVSLNQLQQIANRNAESMWGNVNPGEPIPYYSLDDKIVAYRFNFSIDKKFPDKQSLINECNQGKLSNEREIQWGGGNYGSILMSARTDMPVNLEHGVGVSVEYAYGAFLQEKAEQELGFNYNLERIYYVNGVNIWYHYTNGAEDVYIKPHAPAKIANEQEFLTESNKFDFFCETGDYSKQWDDYLNKGRIMSRAEEWIPYHDECCPFYDWSYGCSPTAAAMLMAYWDHRSMYSSYNYAKLVDFHFERTDPLSGGSCTIDTHVPNVQEQLATAMDTDLSTGGTERVDIAPGYEEVANTYNGYSFSASYHSGHTTTWYFNEVMDEIDANRPLHISISGHSITGVGYDDVDEEVATHYTHQPWIVWVTKTQLQATYPIIPGGSYGLGIEIEKPDGDQDYYGNGSGETMYAGDVYEITWDYDATSGDYVNLYYNTNHGTGAWTTITSNTPNDGVYDWVIPSGIDSDACRIITYLYDPSKALAGADGSYGDFEIQSGGSIQILGSDGKVNTATDPDYYQFYHSYSTWCAVGVRNNTAGENWSMRMFDDNTFSNVLVSSAYSYPVDFVVMDGHHSLSQYRGIKAYRFSGSGNASVEFEGFTETITPGSTYNDSWPAGDVVEMYDVYLTPGEYGFQLKFNSGTADLDIALFGSSGSAYYANRNAFLGRSINTGGGTDESFTYTVTSSDYYGFCVWANDANSANYDIIIDNPGYWQGDVSSNWADAANWSCDMVPTYSMDVTIPAGTPNSPTISTSTHAYCRDLIIESGATLSQSAG
ncbi:MAG: C39 family peptidase, partial [Candidatus Cloacimonetes bacterium]|nr:C39 family peptidase [Candidatus Cloacimonadota bacterium]